MKKLVIFTDSGDTLIDEGTEIYDDRGIVLEAAFHKGADKLLECLREQGYRVAMVADGEKESFENVYRQLGYMDYFEKKIYSSEVGEKKPHPAMFKTALKEMGLTQEDCSRIIMLGNNIKRDIVGANRMGMISVLIDWSPRYEMTPTQEEQVPHYVIHEPLELLTLLEKLEG